MKPQRLLRINELMLREVSQMIERLVTPELEGEVVTVTAVKTAPDLRTARVFVSLLSHEERWPQVLEHLLFHRRTMQQEIGHRVQVKYTPVLEFVQDKTLARADRVLSIINQLGIVPETGDPAPAPKDAEPKTDPSP